MGLRSMSLIFMKDKGSAFTMRFSPQSLVVFVICLLFIPLCLGLSIWLNIHLYTERGQIIQKQLTLQEEVDSNAQKIARLTSLENFLEVRSANILHALIPRNGVLPDGLQTIGMTEEKITQELEEIATQLVENTNMYFATLPDEIFSTQVGNESTINNGNTKELTVPIENTLPVKSATASDIKIEGLDANSQIDEQLQINEGMLPQDAPNRAHVLEPLIASDVKEIDLHFVQVEDVHITTNSDSIKINYILRNAGKKSPVTGKQFYYLLSVNEDVLTKTPLTDVTDNSFRIKYMKEVESVAALASKKIKSGDAVLFEIFEQDKLVFTKVYPII